MYYGFVATITLTEPTCSSILVAQIPHCYETSESLSSDIYQFPRHIFLFKISATVALNSALSFHLTYTIRSP